jgi:type IV pilus assembly protein PilV
MRHRQTGFSLIEVMVTLVVLGIGMLGLAALQITGLRVNDGALMRTRAAMAAADLSDRVRAQRDGFAAGGLGAQGIVKITADGCDNPPQCGDAVTCWQSDFCARYQPADPQPKALPPPANGDCASINCANGNACGNGNCAIIIRWSDERAGRDDPGGGGDAQFQFCTRMP